MSTHPLRLSLLSTWAEKCGIATYSHALADALAEKGVAISVVAPRLRTPESAFGPQPPRVWRRNRAGLIGAWQVFGEVMRQRAEVVHIQHTMGIESPALLLGVSRLCARAGIPVVVTLHEGGGGSVWRRFRFARTLFALRGAHLVVHERDPSIPDATVIPHGIAEVPPIPRAEARASLGLSAADLVLAHFGFLHPDKGIDSVLQAVAELRSSGFPNLKYRICGGTFPTASSLGYLEQLRNRVNELGLTAAVDLSGEFAPEARVTLEMQAADLVVLNYRTGNRQGASGAASRALATGCAMAVSEAPIFDSIRTATHTLGGDLTAELGQLLRNPAELAKLRDMSQALSAERSWPKVAQRHAELYERLLERKRSTSPQV